ALAFGGMVALLRGWGTSGVGSALGGLSYAFGAPILSQQCNIIYLVGGAWLPLGFRAADRWRRRSGRWGLVQAGGRAGEAVLRGEGGGAGNAVPGGRSGSGVPAGGVRGGIRGGPGLGGPAGRWSHRRRVDGVAVADRAEGNCGRGRGRPHLSRRLGGGRPDP